MDADYLLAAASAGYGFVDFQPPQWEDYPHNSNNRSYSSSVVGVREMSIERRDDDDEAEGLGLRRSSARARVAFHGVDGVRDGMGAVAGRRVSARVPGAEAGGKRRWSARLSETIFDFGRLVKERAGSWVGRRDSVQVQAQARSEEVLAGSGERSRDGGDELSFVEVPREVERRRRASAGARMGREPHRIEYVYPVQSFNAGEGLSAALEGRMASWPLEVASYRNQQHRREEQEALAMLEREVRIAERQGAFSSGKRAKLFRKAWANRTTDAAKERASVKYREELALRKKRCDDDFRRWLIEKDMTPLERARSRVENWIRSVSVSRQGSRDDSRGGSGLEDGAESSYEPMANEDSDDEWRQDNIEVARYAGWALQRAPFAL